MKETGTLVEDEPFSGEWFLNFYEGWRFGATVSPSTHRRWRKSVGVEADFPPSYATFLRTASIAGEYLKAEETRCVKAKAHFAAGLILTCRIELLLQVHMALISDEVKKCPYYRNRAKRRGFIKVITSLRFEELLELAKRLGLFSELKLIQRSKQVLRRLNYPVDAAGALKYLRDRRNQLHPAVLVRNVSTILKTLPVDPDKEFDRFHFEFPTIALQILGAINDKPLEGGRVLHPF